MDADLDDLLNDALSDFDKKPSEAVKTLDEVKNSSKSEVTGAAVRPEKISKDTADSATSNSQTGGNMAPPADIFDQFFDPEMSQKLQQEWESAMKELVDDDPELASQLKNISSTMETAATASMSATGASSVAEPVEDESVPQQSTAKALNKVMEETILGIGHSAEEVNDMSNASAEEKLMQEMKNLGLGGGPTGGAGLGDMMGQLGDMEGMENSFISMMEGMMENLLSKDVLYPTMKEISEVYPGWLETNKGKVSEKDYKRYEQQSIIIKKICENFEADNENDTKDVKKQRLNELMNLVEGMQECGNPPQELLGKCAGGNEMDVSKIFGAGGGGGLPMFGPPGANMNPDNCAIM